jgi:hypothetical protein
MPRHDPGRVAPFGDRRITACALLPGAFRRLPRPSSARSRREASIVCPFRRQLFSRTIRLRPCSLFSRPVLLQIRSTRAPSQRARPSERPACANVSSDVAPDAINFHASSLGKVPQRSDRCPAAGLYRPPPNGVIGRDQLPEGMPSALQPPAKRHASGFEQNRKWSGGDSNPCYSSVQRKCHPTRRPPHARRRGGRAPFGLVGHSGFEPETSVLSGLRSNPLS